MDYEKAYKELVGKIKNAHLYALTDSTKNVLENILPELAESENEKIRKELKHYLEIKRCQTNDDDEYLNCNYFLAWLEKQKPVEQQMYWTEEEIEPIISDYLCGREHYGGMIGRLCHLKPKQKPIEWSEEDERIISKILGICEDFKSSFRISPASSKIVQKDIDKINTWLKSIKERIQKGE